MNEDFTCGTRGPAPELPCAPRTVVAGMRRQLLSEMGRVEDYLDWHEATQSHALSGTFHDYLRAAAECARPPVPRRDPLTRYLNLMESEYQE